MKRTIEEEFRGERKMMSGINKEALINRQPGWNGEVFPVQLNGNGDF